MLFFRQYFLFLICMSTMLFPTHAGASEKRLSCILEKTCIQGQGCFEGATPWPVEYILTYDDKTLVAATRTEAICTSNSRVKISKRYISFSCNSVIEGQDLWLWSTIDRFSGAYEDGQQEPDDPTKKIFEQGTCSERKRKF